MAALAGILALCVLLAVGYALSTAAQKTQAEFENANRMKQLEDNISTLKKTVASLEKRIHNVEDIVTDTKFSDLPESGREAINLKAEMNELKSMIKNLKR